MTQIDRRVPEGLCGGIRQVDGQIPGESDRGECDVVAHCIYGLSPLNPEESVKKNTSEVGASQESTNLAGSNKLTG